jgi:uncharacterized protein
MKKTLLVMAAAVLFLALSAFLQGGAALLWRGINAGIAMFIQVLPMLVAAFALSGLIQVLINPQQISRLLGRESGTKGLLLAAVVGGILPGGPYVYYPIAASFVSAGAEGATIMSFVVGKSLWDLSRAPMEVAIMGGRVTAIRYAVTLVFPLFIGLLARWLFPNLTADMIQPVQKEENQC